MTLIKEPCIIPQCSHIPTVENMDRQIEMWKRHQMDENRAVTQIKPSSMTFSMDEMK